MPGKTKKTNVLKSLSPEEQALMSNMKAIMQELDTLQNNDPEINDPEINSEVVEEGMDSDAGFKKDFLKAMKQLAGNTEDEDEPDDKTVEKEDKGPTVDDSAEEKVSIQTENNDAAASEIGKALFSLLKKQTPAKSVQKSNNIEHVIAKALKPLVDQVNQVQTFNSNILDALGMSEQVEKSIKEQPVQKSLQNSGNPPVQNTDASAIVKELVNAIKSQAAEKNEEPSYKNDWHGVQKSRDNLKDALPAIFSGALSREK